MSSLFPRWTNSLPAALALGGGGATAAIAASVWYWFTPSFWEVGYQPTQPVDYSHQIHVGQLGMDCRYCHTHVEEAGHSNVPTTETCMSCHTGADDGAFLNADLWAAHAVNPNLVKLREAWDSGEPVQWRRVHKVPDYAHFNHAVHVNAGVSCYSCHGRIDHQAVVRQVENLSMGWCLDCHREPEVHLVDNKGLLNPDDPVRVTDLGRVHELVTGPEQRERGLELAKRRQLQPPENCGACHY